MSTTKAKRKLSDISFDHTGAHLALCSKEQGAANGVQHALVMKSSANFSPEFIQKMQAVKVTMTVPEFLNKFFHLYGTDCEVLARMLGYVPEEKEEPDSYEDYYENLIQERLDSFEILKGLYVAKSLPEAISKLTEDQYMQVLKAQVQFEKAPSEKITKGQEPAKETTMTIETVTPEAIEKAAADRVQAVEKALNEKLEAVNKALKEASDKVAAYEAEKKETIRKARLEALKEVVKDEKRTESLFKALSLLESDEDYTELLGILKAIMAPSENSEMFKEKGASVEGVNKGKSTDLVRERMKAKYQNATK